MTVGVNLRKEEAIMKCPVCGRGMFVRGNCFECPNILCDYEEEIEDNELIRRLKQGVPVVDLNERAITLS